MSIKAMAWVWDHGPADTAECMVLLALADYAGEDGRAWPSVANLAAKARVAERSVRRILRRLESAGWIVQETHHRGRKSQTYRLTLKPVEALNPDGGSGFNPDPVTGFNPDGGSGFAAPTLTLSTANPDPGSPNPSRTIITTATATRARTREADQKGDERPNVVALPGGRSEDRNGLVADLVDMASQASPGGIPPAGWLNPVVAVHVGRWLDLGLTHGEVRQVAAGQLARWGKPPGKPEWWDRSMRALADAKAAPPPEASAPAPRRDQPNRPDVADIFAKLEKDGRL